MPVEFEVEDSIAARLKSFARDMRRTPAVTLTELRIGRAATPKALERSQVAPDLIELAQQMNGFCLAWTSRGGSRQGRPGGRIEVPTLAVQAKGWDSLAFNESPDADLGVCVVDVAPASDGLFACYADGDLGVWRLGDDTFTVEGFGFDEYFEAGIRNLFVPGWLEHVLSEDFESIAPEAAVTRGLLGLPQR